MTEGCIRAAVDAIHSTPTKAVVYLSGGASQALGWLMSLPGASNTILEVVVPYSKNSMTQLLGKVRLLNPACSLHSFFSFLMFIFMRKSGEDYNYGYSYVINTFQSMFGKAGLPVLGVGFTGSLATTYTKHGDHRFYLSTRTCDRLWTSSVTLLKGLRTREEEDRVSSHFLLKAISDACKVSATFSSELYESEVPDEYERQVDEDEELQQIIDGKLCMKIYDFSGDKDTASERMVILPGSFNPLHDGHLRLSEIASRY
nr:PREDICTED: uncharacterized protein LOC103981708 [Musa acuminata subsp. malaccensis]